MTQPLTLYFQKTGFHILSKTIFKLVSNNPTTIAASCVNWHIVPRNPYKARGKIHAAHNVQLLQSGEEYFAKLEQLIAAAEHEIHLQTYIFDNDATGKRIAAALVEASLRGVEVYLVVDAYGSKNMGSLSKTLAEAKVKIRFFGSVYTGKQWAWGRRLHHKIFVADRSIALVGGINISNHYSGMDGHTPWLDYALLVEGMVCKNIFNVCKKIFAQWYLPKRRRFRLFEKITSENKKIGVQLRQNDWLRGKNQVPRSYIKALKTAKTEVIIANSYFLPGKQFRQALKNAVSNGVKVKILLPGISDVPLAKQAMQYLYAYMMRNGIEIYKWQPSVLHAKIACIDGQWCTVGSYNLNYLSAYASIEFNINVLDEGFCKKFQTQLDSLLIHQCVKVVDHDFIKRQTIFSKFWLWTAYQLIRLSEALLITFPGQRFFNKNNYA